jgi:DNA processing protein
VMGVPGRVDSTASDGTHELLKQGAHLVCTPADVIGVLEGHARHLHAGTHDAMTADPARQPSDGLFGERPEPETPIGDLSEMQRAILTHLAEPRSAEDLGELVGLDAGRIRAELTMMELGGRVKRAGSRFQRAR